MATAKKARKKVTTNGNEDGTPEGKAQKFVRLANQRVSAAVKKIHQIGNLGSAGYESTDEQRKKIETALSDAVLATVNRLNKTVVKPSGFSL